MVPCNTFVTILALNFGVAGAARVNIEAALVGTDANLEAALARAETKEGEENGNRLVTVHAAMPRKLEEDVALKPCGDGMAVHLKPPWEDMDASVDGASTVDSCRQCAQTLESQGYLMNGWDCYSGWWSVYLRRRGDTALAAIKSSRSFDISKVDGAGPLVPGSNPLPESLQGVFWLSNQKTQSALITFAPNGEADCQWCSHGSLILNRYLIRVSGDRVWSFATEENAGYDLARGLRLVYDFSFDSATDPTHATIFPIPTQLGSFGSRLSKQTWLLNFDQTLLPAEAAASLGYPGSVVWERKSYVLGVEAKSSRYHVVQVVDPHGRRIEPAWSKFVAYQQSAEAGDQPGILFYHGDEK